MPRSFYKGEWLGKTPACAICMGRGHGPRALLHLPLGVSVWLCEAHRDPGADARITQQPRGLAGFAQRALGGFVTATAGLGVRESLQQAAALTDRFGRNLTQRGGEVLPGCRWLDRTELLDDREGVGVPGVAALVQTRELSLDEAVELLRAPPRREHRAHRAGPVVSVAGRPLRPPVAHHNEPVASEVTAVKEVTGE